MHFYSKFWSFTCSNSDTWKRFWASRRRAALRAAPARRAASASGPRADRGHAPSQDPCAPRRLEVRRTRASSAFAPYTRAPCTGRTAGPSSVPPVRVPTEATDVPRWYLRRHPDVTGEPPLFKCRKLPPSRLPPSLRPLHCARHGLRLASRRPTRPFVHRASEHLPRDRKHCVGLCIAQFCAPLAGPQRLPSPCAAARPRRRPLLPNFGHHRALGEHVVKPHHLPGRMRRRNRRCLASRTA
jgi:hypothetical protein